MATLPSQTRFRLISSVIFLYTLLSGSSATKGIECHDCTGLEECGILLENQWTGKCRTQTGGKCFIRRDPNGIIYRGCADPVNWPQLDITYNGCRYQSYGSWGKTSVIWCLCDFDLCNTNISFVMLKFPGASDAGVQAEINQGQGQTRGQGVSQGSKSGSGVQVPGGVWSFLEKEKLESSDRTNGGVGVKNQGGSSGGGGGIQWGGGLHGNALYGSKSGYNQGHGNNEDSSSWYWAIGNVPSNPDGAGHLPKPPIIHSLPGKSHLPPWTPGMDRGRDLDWRIIEKYLEWLRRSGYGKPPVVNYPTTPDNRPILSTPPDTNFPSRPPVNPWMTTRGPQNEGPLYKIPDELLQYLLKNLPRDSNDVRSIPYPVYVILYLLVTSGFDISTIDGLNIYGGGGFTIPPYWPWGFPHGNSSYHQGCPSVDCQHYCQFVKGQPTCQCRPGFTLASDSRSCNDVNECVSANRGGCSQLCFNTIGSYFCDCNRNYELLTDRQTCRDIDECSYRNGGCSDICLNLPGSYSCSCRHGFTLGLDNRTCFSENDCRNLSNQKRCSQMCINATCACFHGYRLGNDGVTCLDIDECADNSHGCSQLCTNTPGSYVCACREGFRLTSNIRDCLDDDECLQNNGGCSQSCTNTPGSYRCSCVAGYTLYKDQKTCDDIDECMIKNGGCEQNCTNTPGSFRCSCNAGQSVDPDQKNCRGGCPVDFIRSVELGSCYKIITPIPSQASVAQSVLQATDRCRQFHPNANLISLETVAELDFLAKLLIREPAMLEGWQGWWTSGIFRAGINQFYWGNGANIPNTNQFWGFQRPPLQDTCVWILQIPNYNYTLGNYDCNTASGFVCEISLADLANAP